MNCPLVADEQLFNRIVDTRVVIGLILVLGSGVGDSTVTDTLIVSTDASELGSLLKSIGSVSGVPVDPWAKAVVLTSGSPQDTNTLAEPAKVVPVSRVIAGVRPTFDFTLAPWSFTVLELQGR